LRHDKRQKYLNPKLWKGDSFKESLTKQQIPVMRMFLRVLSAYAKRKPINPNISGFIKEWRELYGKKETVDKYDPDGKYICYCCGLRFKYRYHALPVYCSANCSRKHLGAVRRTERGASQTHKNAPGRRDN